jgi:hypothetical protein
MNSAASWAAIVVALISALGAWAAQRSARSATTVSEKTKAETEAYIRARKMDVETIERQDKELDELRRRDEARELAIRELRVDNEKLHNENIALRRRVAALERQGEEP